MKELTKDELSKLNIPKGYILVPDPALIEIERKNKELLELEVLISETPIPKDEELVEYGKLYHPYYDNLRRLDLLK